MTEPSPQRTPVLFQAGASSRGRRFAATHAECVFLSALTPQALAPVVADIRATASARGRRASDILCFGLMTAIVAETDEAARRKLEEYRNYLDLEASLASLSGFTGLDLSRYAPDDPFPAALGDSGVHSIVEALSRGIDGRRPTIRDVAEWGAIGGSGPLVVGSPVTVADVLERWADECGLDGFNLSYATCPGDFEDFIALVVPELQRRGRYKLEYETGTLREKLFGFPCLRAPHPAALHRIREARDVLPN